MKHSEKINPILREQTYCGLCGSKKITTRQEEVSIPVNSRKREETLQVAIPVHHCSACDIDFTTPEAAKIEHDAVCKYLKVMTPSEVRGIREIFGLTQNEFAEKTGIGVASINRWEKGGSIQNPAMDNFLYLIGISGNLDALSFRASKAEDVISVDQKFSAINGDSSKFKRYRQAFAL